MSNWSRRKLLETAAAGYTTGMFAETQDATTREAAARTTAAGAPSRKDKLRIALMQVEITFDVEGNYRRAFQSARDTGREKPDLMVFPELFGVGYRADGIRPYAQKLSGDVCQEFRVIARETGSHIIFGLPLARKAGFYNSAVIMSPGGVVGIYDKTHLVWDPTFINEAALFLPGQRLGNFNTALCPLGVYICHDGLFPETPRCLTLNGAELLVYCVNDGPPAIYAREHSFYNKIPVAAVNPVLSIYDERGKKQGGGSALVSADRTVVCESKAVKEEVLIGEVDLAVGRTLRKEGFGGEDIFRVRRPDLYGPLVRPKATPGTLFGIRDGT